MKCIFSIAPVERLAKSREYFSLRSTHWTLVLVVSDAGLASGVLLVFGTCEYRASEHPTGERRTWPDHCSHIR